MEDKRGGFTGKAGFVLAAAGSAVGLGNIWRFPYLAAKYGGGIFLLVYAILTFTFGFTLLSSEIAIGRKTGKSVIGAFRSLDRRFSFIGYIEALVPIIVAPYYSVIGGRVFKYFVVFASGDMDRAVEGEFYKNFVSSNYEPIFWFLLFVLFTIVAVLLGVEKGVEKINKIMMPLLVLLTIFIAIYSLFMPGAIEGLIYYIKPNFSAFSGETLLAAMGQLFYSMSIAMGIMITYGSYMKKDSDISSCISNIEIFDTGIAFLAGLMIVPAVFVFSGGSTEALSEGPGLMFVTLPKVFSSMSGGNIVGAAFFLMVLFAALTSSVSMVETIVSIFCEKFKIKRKTACLIVFLICITLGIPSSLGSGMWSHIKVLGYSFLDFFDFLANNILMPISALITCIFIGYVINPKVITDEIEKTKEFKRKGLYIFMVRYVAPVCIIFILLSGFGII